MSDLKEMAVMAETILDLDRDIAEMEDSIKALKDAQRHLAEVALPEAMENAGVNDFSMKDGRKVSLKIETYAGISAAHKPEAFAWLRENGHDAIIKRQVIVDFGKGEDVKAEEFFQSIVGRPELADNNIVGKQTVHASTLKSFVRKALESGEEIPHEPFGIHQRTIAKLGTVKR